MHEQQWIAFPHDRVEWAVKIPSRAGQALILALLSLSLPACGNGPVFQGKKADASSLQSSARDPQVRAFYQARQWKTAWDKKSEKQLLDIIAGAPSNGLKPDLFLKGDLPKDSEQREAALTAAALKYASALARGYADPRKISADYTIPRPDPDVADEFLLPAGRWNGDFQARP